MPNESTSSPDLQVCDLAQRTDKIRDIIKETAGHVGRMEDPNGFSFSALCVELGLTEDLRESARANDDVLAFAQATIADLQVLAD